MKLSIVILILCLGLCNAESFWWEEMKAPQLTKESYKELIGKSKYVLIEFYTRSCNICEELYPTLNEIYEDLNSGKIDRRDFIFMHADGEEWEQLGEKLNVDGYPTIVLYKPGDKDYPETYNFGHDYSSIKNYILSQAPAPSFIKGSRFLK